MSKLRIYMYIFIYTYIFDNINSGEDIFNFFVTQQDYDKKLLQMEFEISADYVLMFRNN